MDELNSRAMAVFAGNRFLVLGTVDDDGRPRVSPVYFTHSGSQSFYWVSSPEAHHSRNIASRPRISFVVFDSSVTPAQGPSGVYVDADAAEVPEADLPEQCALAWANPRDDDGTRPFAPEELSGEASLRLYRAVATRHQVHVRGSDPTYGTGIDHRETVEL